MSKCDSCINKHNGECSDKSPFPEDGCKEFTKIVKQPKECPYGCKDGNECIDTDCDTECI